MSVLEITGEQEDAILYAARRVVGRYRAYAQVDDLVQEARAWVASHPAKVADYFRDAEDERALTVALRRFGRQVEKVMERIAREEKAIRSGYRPEDEFFYGLALLEAVLPAMFNPELAAVPPVTEREEISAKTDPAESGNWQAMVMDVERAIAAIDPTVAERTALYLRYGVGLGEERAAAVMQLNRFPYRDLLNGVLRRLSWQLNGLVPDRGAPDIVED